MNAYAREERGNKNKASGGGGEPQERDISRFELEPPGVVEDLEQPVEDLERSVKEEYRERILTGEPESLLLALRSNERVAMAVIADLEASNDPHWAEISSPGRRVGVMNDRKGIDCSSRARAIADGLLIDVTGLARESGFWCPVAVSARAWGTCVSGPGETARLHALLDLLRHSLIPLDGGSERVEFAVDILNDDRPGELVRLCVVCGQGDDGEPAITVMLDHEQRHEGGGGEATRELLSRCPRCGGEIQATVERYYGLRGGVWVESGVDGDNRLYCENDCDLSEYAGRFPELG